MCLWSLLTFSGVSGLVLMVITWTKVDLSPTWITGTNFGEIRSKIMTFYHKKWNCCVPTVGHGCLDFECISLNEKLWISLQISLKFVSKVPINNIPALVQLMTLSEPMMVTLLMRICTTRPQWVNYINEDNGVIMAELCLKEFRWLLENATNLDIIGVYPIMKLLYQWVYQSNGFPFTIEYTTSGCSGPIG